MKQSKYKLPKSLLRSILLLTLLANTTSVANPLLTDTQLHAVLGVVTNFMLEPTVIPIKKTGQTQSYDDLGTVVTDGSQKDDGFYQKGVTSNYTRDDTKNIVLDHITGLQWQDDINASTVTKPWLTVANNVSPYTDTSGDTATTYCSNLTLGGFTDWRLPTSEELVSISVYGQIAPTTDATFQNTASGIYWSSTTYLGGVNNAFIVDFSMDSLVYLFAFSKNNSCFVRCVRGGYVVPPTHFSRTGNIVIDNSRGLQWQDNAVGIAIDWQIAIDYCETLSLDGFSDWRLPNINELNSIINNNTISPAIENTFQNTNSFYWSSTTNANNIYYAWGVDFSYGLYFGRPKFGFPAYVRCVRNR